MKRVLGQWRSTLAASCVALSLGSATASAADPGRRDVVPVFQHRLSNGDIRFFVMVRIGGAAPIEAMLDTGSFGLRILARALGVAEVVDTGIARGYGYGSGVVLRGPLVRAPVAVGGTMTTAPIGVQVVRSVVCAVEMPECPASKLALEDYGIGGDGLRGEGFPAIMGVSLRGTTAREAATNPLAALGGQWVLLLPRPGDTTPGQLIISPNAADVKGFHPVLLRSLPPLADGTKQVMDSQIPNCPDLGLQEQARCPAMTLDSGAGLGVGPFYTYAVLFNSVDDTMAVKRR